MSYIKKKIEDHIKEGNMKKLFIPVVLFLLMVLPLGSTQNSAKAVKIATSSHDKNVWTYESYQEVLGDREKQHECLAKNIYFEARNEPFVGQLAAQYFKKIREPFNIFLISSLSEPLIKTFTSEF